MNKCAKMGLLLLVGMFFVISSRCISLVEAARDGNVEQVTQLIASGADVEQTNEAGWNALVSAVWEDHTEVVQILLRAGAEDLAGLNPLMCAAGKGNREIVQSFFTYGTIVVPVVSDRSNRKDDAALQLVDSCAGIPEQRAQIVRIALKRCGLPSDLIRLIGQIGG